MFVFSIFNLSAQTEISKYDLFENLNKKDKDIYEDFYKKVSFFKDENIAQNSDSLNLTYFSNNGNIFNVNNLNFINHHFGDNLYTKDSFPFLYNINQDIGSSINQIEKEDNFIKMNIKLKDFYERLKNDYKTKYFEKENEKIKNTYYSNEIFVKDYTQYNFDKKFINILLGNLGSNNHRIQFFCKDNIKFAYIFSKYYAQSKNKFFYSGVQFTPIYIGLPDTIKNELREYKNNQCVYTKFFETHEEAGEYLEVLESDKSEFGLFFKINKESETQQLYYEATAKSFGLYNIQYEYLEPYHVIYQDDLDEEIYPVKNIFKTLLDNNYLDYSDSFKINEDFKPSVFYETNAGFKINLNAKNNQAKILNENLKAKYNIIKNDYYYTLELDKVDKLSSYNIPAKMILRKIDKKYDLFIKNTQDFKVNIYSIDLGDQSIINYEDE